MHGTNDDLVPYEHSQRLFDCAKENKELWLVEGAWHCALFDLNPGKSKAKTTTRCLYTTLL